MIPESLTIKGLYSYQKQQTIDFSPLLSSGLFGIFGTVGSGKSSILEAITFALYNKTERLNQQDNRNYNMMNLKSDELLIDFTFTNFDQERYRFTVNGKRHGSTFETVNTFKRGAYIHQGGKWVPLETTSGETILGLSYDNFRRTIIIPQGKFQEFLQLGDKDRTAMMKEIFHLDKYEFGYQTNALDKKNNYALERLHGEQKQFEGLSPEIVKEKETAADALSQSLKKAEQQLKTHHEQLQQLKQLQQLFDEYEATQQTLQQLERQKAKIEQQKVQLKHYEYCDKHFRPLLNKLQESSASLQEKQKTLKDYQQQATTLSEETKKLHHKLEKASTDHAQLDHKREAIDDCSRLLSMYEEQENINTTAERTKKGEAFIKKEQEKSIALESTIKNIKQKLQDLKANQPDVSELAEAKEWFTQHRHMTNELAQLQQDLSETEKQLNNISVKDILPGQLKAHCKGSTFSDIITSIKNYQQTLENTLQETQHQREHYLLQLKMEEFADNLENGAPCPLCGATDHPNPAKTGNATASLDEINASLQSLQQQVNACTEAISNVKELSFQYEHHEKAHKKTKESITDLTKKAEQHLQAFHWTSLQPDDPSTVDERMKEAKVMKANITALEKELADTEKQYELALKNTRRYTEEVDAIRLQYTEATSRYNTLKSQLKTYAPDAFRDKDELLQHKKATEARVTEVKEAYEYFSQQHQQHQQQLAQVQGKCESLSQTVEEVKSTVAKNEASLEEVLAGSPFEQLAEVKDILRLALDTEKVRQEINDFDQQLYKSREDLKRLRAQTKDKVFDANQLHELTEQTTQYEQKVKELNREHIELRSTIKRLKKDLAKARSLAEQISKLEERAENLRTLKNLFKGSGFVNYISGVHLQQLCNAANERFYKLTRQQLRLELNEDNTFQVRDFMNNGKLRSAKTLSGGQTFQAALSLALALADSVQQQNKSRQNFFFLDEGFGSLDKEALQTVFETLKSLRREDRVVGIISHVEELQQEISTFLQIENDQEKGSTLRGSWEMV